MNTMSRNSQRQALHGSEVAGTSAAPPNVRDVAIAAHAAGLCVHPPTQDGVKRPVDKWAHHMKARSTLEEILAWYGSAGTPKRGGVGYICGAVSGNLEVFEFDAAGLVYEEYKAAAAATGFGDVVERIEAGCSEQSPTGGIHWFSYCSEIAGSTELARYVPDPNDIDPGTKRPKVKVLIETRGEGGYIVAAPSNGTVHPTGGAYVQLRGGPATIATITPAERQALHDLARTFDRVPEPEPVEAKPKTTTSATACDALTPWDDYNARMTWSELLPGWTLVHRSGETEYWRRPGKNEGWSATVNRNGSDRLFVFSTSTEFEARKPYSKFDAYSRLNHTDDASAATKALSEAGYGQFKTWVKVDGKWKLEIRQNPCPKGTRIARPGEDPPAEVKFGGRKRKTIARLETGDGEPIHLTDLGNARRLVGLFGDRIRYCAPWRRWLIWDGTRWREDATEEIYRLAKKVPQSIRREAAKERNEERAKQLFAWAIQSESKKRIEATIALARSEPGVPVEPSDLNRDPWLLNVSNGTIDLMTGRLRPHQQGDLITKIAPVAFDPQAKCEKWEAVLMRVLGCDWDLIGFVRRALGYALSGNVGEHAIFFLFGTGRNGKSTVLDTVLALLGDYACTVDAGLITAKQHADHPTGLTDLDGCRFVPTIEVEDGKRLAEALVKKLTGGDRIKARRMHKDNYEFYPTHKIFLAANHEPEIKGTDEGIWSRIKMIPFRVFIPPEERVKDLDKKLVTAEGPGILAWLVRGCLEWQRIGLADPRVITEATAGYRAEQNVLGRFFEECCVVQPGQEQIRVKASALYGAYRTWAEQNGEGYQTLTQFGRDLVKLGIQKKAANGIWYLGIGLRPNNKKDNKKD